MIKKWEVVEITYGNYNVGALSFDVARGYGTFEYSKGFTQTGIELL